MPNDDIKKGFSLKIPKFLKNVRNRFKKKVNTMNSNQLTLITMIFTQESAQADLDLAKNVKITQHLLSLEELSLEFKTDLKHGLTETEASLRLSRDGPNAFTPPKQTPEWLKFTRELTGGFALLLWFASAASFVSYGLEKNEQDVSHLNSLVLSCQFFS